MSTTASTFYFVGTGAAVQISAFNACNSGQPMAYANYTTANGSQTNVQLCRGAKTLTNGLVVNWDGSTTQDPSGFSATYNGVALQSSIGSGGIVQCSSLPNSGTYVACSPGPGPGPNPNPNPKPSSSGIKWWQILLIVIGALLLIAALAAIIYAATRRKKQVITT